MTRAIALWAFLLSTMAASAQTNHATLEQAVRAPGVVHIVRETNGTMSANMQGAVVEAFGWTLDVPTSLLFVMFGLIVWIICQANLGTRWSDAFQDDGGKTSIMRLAVFVALAITSWQIVSITLRVQPTVELLERLSMFFIVVWSGAKIVEKLIDVLLAKFGVRAPPQ